MRALSPRLLLALGLASLAVLSVAATSAAAPARTSAGTLTFCTDATYPPEEFYQGSKIVGSDIDIATEVAKRLGMTAKFQNTGFDGIIASLLAKKCDAIISGMNDTACSAHAGGIRGLHRRRPVADGEEGKPQEDHVGREPLRAHRFRRGRHDEQDLPRPAEREAEEAGQVRDQDHDVPEGHGRRERAQDGPRGRVLRRRPGRCVLHPARPELRVRGLAREPDPGRDRAPQERSADRRRCGSK